MKVFLHNAGGVLSWHQTQNANRLHLTQGFLKKKFFFFFLYLRKIFEGGIGEKSKNKLREKFENRKKFPLFCLFCLCRTIYFKLMQFSYCPHADDRTGFCLKKKKTQISRSVPLSPKISRERAPLPQIIKKRKKRRNFFIHFVQPFLTLQFIFF